MEPPQGVVAGDLRVLVTRTGLDLTYTSLATSIQALVVGQGWKVTVTPVDSTVVLVERRVRRRSTAELLRNRVVRCATQYGIDRTEVARVTRLLGA